LSGLKNLGKKPAGSNYLSGLKNLDKPGNADIDTRKPALVGAVVPTNRFNSEDKPIDDLIDK
jgi:hypothetical protein